MLRSSFTRRKVFISYFKGDKQWVDRLVYEFGQPSYGVFIPHVVGVMDVDDFVNSSDVEYIMRAIRQRYLQDTTVTIVVIGRCTHSRKFVDWEIKSSLTQPANGKPNGLLGLAVPPPMDLRGKPLWHNLPLRFERNYSYLKDKESFAIYREWPTTGEQLRQWIEEAYQRVTTHTHFIENPQEIVGRNLLCKIHNIAHVT